MGYVGDDEMIKGEEGMGAGGGGGIHLSICAHVKNPKHWQPYSYHRFDTRNQVGMGTATTAAAVPYQGRARRVSSDRGQCSKRKIN